MGKKVYIVGGDYLVEKMFSELGGYEICPDPYYADLAVFTGGEDVTPSYYGAEAHTTTYSNRARDNAESKVSAFFLARGIPMVGICRGAQFLCVMNGGSLYQDVDRHAISGEHTLLYTDEKGQTRTYNVTSTHHQMQNPYTDADLTFELWGSADRCTYRDSETVERAPLNDNAHPDVEIVYWPNTKCLGFQPHPEYRSESTREIFEICLNRLWSRG